MKFHTISIKKKKETKKVMYKANLYAFTYFFFISNSKLQDNDCKTIINTRKNYTNKDEHK